MPENENEVQEREKHFGVIAEIDGYEKHLVLLNLPFGRLIDEIVVPYETDEPFFIDGVPAIKSKIKRIKIVEFGDQYDTRFEHILHTDTVDVTAQVIKAYNQIIKPSIKNYLPKREELIGAATKLFIKG